MIDILLNHSDEFLQTLVRPFASFCYMLWDVLFLRWFFSPLSSWPGSTTSLARASCKLCLLAFSKHSCAFFEFMLMNVYERLCMFMHVYACLCIFLRLEKSVYSAKKLRLSPGMSKQRLATNIHLVVDMDGYGTSV